MHCAFMYFQVIKLTFEMKGIIAKYLNLPEIRFETSSSISSPSFYCLCKKKKNNNKNKSLASPTTGEYWKDKYIGVNLFYWLFMQKPIKVDHDCY